MIYFFMSFANIHTRKNEGCCIVRVKSPDDANEEAKRLGLMPQVCNQARIYPLSDAEFSKQGIELNRFYFSHEMDAMGFKKR